MFDQILAALGYIFAYLVIGTASAFLIAKTFFAERNRSND